VEGTLVSLEPKPGVNLTRFQGVFAPNNAYRAQRLKRVFDIDVATCSECGGDVRTIVSIEDPVVIRTILAHLGNKGVFAGNSQLPDCRASPGLPMGLTRFASINS